MLGLLTANYKKLSRNVAISQRLCSLRQEKSTNPFQVRPRGIQADLKEPSKIPGFILPLPMQMQIHTPRRAVLVRRSKSALESLSQQDTRHRAGSVPRALGHFGREYKSKLREICEKNNAVRERRIGEHSNISLENYLHQACKSYHLQHIRGYVSSPKARTNTSTGV
jgi:hypothetical protein